MTDEILDWLDGRIAGTIESGDLIDQVPNLDENGAYKLQIAYARRLAQRSGERLLGYKAAFTNAAMLRMYNMTGPTIGSLLSGNCYEQGADIPVGTDGKYAVEPEILVLLKRDLVGPGVRVADVIAATEGVLPAIELATPLVGGPKRSRQLAIAASKFTGCNVFGTRMISLHSIDLRLEGCVLSLNGEPKASATAVEVLGNPLRVVAMIANRLAEIGENLRAGMVVMTGSVVAAVPVKPGDELMIEFTRVGAMRAKITSL